jgi:GT2 family glycosyltransferase
MSAKTPIAIFAYNRPDHTRLLLESLIKCARLDECAVYIYCDGARNPEHIVNVQAARQVAREFSLSLNNAHIIERDQNMGVDHSIVNGVTELCAQYGRIIVLEDDLVLHPQFLNYMLSSLDRYENEVRVAQISGYMFPVKHAITPDAFFLPYITSWGWATWKRSWELFDWSPDISALGDEQIKSQFNHNGITNHSEMLLHYFAGYIFLLGGFY